MKTLITYHKTTRIIDQLFATGDYKLMAAAAQRAADYVAVLSQDTEVLIETILDGGGYPQLDGMDVEDAAEWLEAEIRDDARVFGTGDDAYCPGIDLDSVDWVRVARAVVGPSGPRLAV